MPAKISAEMLMYFLRRNFKQITFQILALIFFALPAHLNAQTLPPNFNTSLYVNILWDQVEGFRFDATGQMYVWEKKGKVWVIDTNKVKISTPLLDISEEVGDWRDHGLNGFVLDPNFRTNGYFYLQYVVDRHYLMNYGTANYHSDSNEYFNATIQRVTRYTANPSTNFTTVIPGSRLVLIGEDKKTGIPVLHESHSGCQLTFGRDGSLLVTTGDGASFNGADGGSFSETYWSQALADSIIKPKENVGAFRSQLVDCLNGKILRIDPTNGNGLPSNPFYDSANPRSARSRVWCLGLRNPFRMTYRPGTGSTDITAGNPGVFYLGDVGWGTYEDINVATGPGMNFGWPLFEGLTPSPDYQALTVFNQDAPNPLYGINGCAKQYFQFKQLCIQDTLTSNPSWPNPCKPSVQIPSTLYRFKHARPVVDYQHFSPHTRTGIWNGTSASQIDINDTLSPVKGPIFPGNASVGGAWYTGAKYPFIYQNTYFHADYAQNWIKNLKFKSDNTADSVKDFGSSLGPIVFIEYNPKDQLLYYVKYPNYIYKLSYNGSINNPPTAVASEDTSYGIMPLLVNFKGNNSNDPEKLPLLYSWNFGDGSAIDTAMNPTHTFISATNDPVAYTVTLTVKDNIGQTSQQTLNVYLNDSPPQIAISSFKDGDLFTMSHNTNKSLQANVFDTESSDGNLSYAWQTFLHHNDHEHPEAIDTNRITTSVISPIGCDGNTYYYRIQLTVTDPIGLSATTQASLYPACNSPVPDFSADLISVCPNQVVNFTDKSLNLPDSWLWSFPGGNPSSSILQNPSVSYTASGPHKVSLKVTSTRGNNSITKSNYILINSEPAAIITPSETDTVCSGTPVLLTANVALNLSYQWQKSGVDISGAINQTYLATTAGSYKVKVTNTVAGCSKISKAEKIVYSSITAKITEIGSTTFCTGDSVVLKANSGTYSYQWSKNNIDIPNATNINYAAKTSGTYKVKVIDTHGCFKVSQGVVVTVNCFTNTEIKTNSIFNTAIIPNPNYGTGIIKITSLNDNKVTVEIFDAVEKKLKTLLENFSINKGENKIPFNISGFSNGTYFIKITTDNNTKTLKIILNARK